MLRISLLFHNHQMASTGGQSLSLSSNVPLLNYQPGLYQQATINIPGLAQQSVPLQARPTQLCAQSEPFQQTLIVCPPTIQGELQALLPNHTSLFYLHLTVLLRPGSVCDVIESVKC